VKLFIFLYAQQAAGNLPKKRLKKFIRNAIKFSETNGEKLPELKRTYSRAEPLMMKYIMDHFDRMREIASLLPRETDIPGETIEEASFLEEG
jgi:hypothetical protein